MKILINASKKILIIAFWIIIWWLLSLKVDNELIFPNPFVVIKKLLSFSVTTEFWAITLSSLFRVLRGIIFSIIVGSLLAYASYKIKIIYEILSPIMTTARATPVASFIILIALFIGAAKVPSIITIIMVTPIIWQSVYAGFNDISPELKEVCTTYKLPGVQQLKCLYLPAVMPYFTSSVLTSIGLGWKAGIAAEILFPPLKSIGKSIADSNMLLNTVDLFAWTLAVVMLSIIFEAITKFTIKLLSKKGGRKVDNK